MYHSGGFFGIVEEIKQDNSIFYSTTSKGEVILGEWIQLTFEKAIQPGISKLVVGKYIATAPKDVVLLGSNNAASPNGTWDVIVKANDLQYSSEGYSVFGGSNEKSYHTYRLVVTRIGCAACPVHFAEWTLSDVNGATCTPV
jgi:hypothetical protein